MYRLMEVDKRNGKVLYNDELHRYWIDGTDLTCISVTTLIGKFHQPFDEDFWSSYKTLEKIMEKDFKLIKSDLLSTKEFDKSRLKNIGIDEDLFDITKKEILKEWENKRNESCIRGTKIHAEHEYGHYGENTPEIKTFGLGGKFYCEKDYYELDKEKGVYPEYLVTYITDDNLFRLAGQVDLIIKDGNDLYIVDYKTNKKLEEKSYFDTKAKKHTCMLYPVNNLMDCNMVHYQLQMSIYA